MDQNFSKQPIEKTLDDLRSLIEAMENNFHLSKSNKTHDHHSLKKNEIRINKLKIIFDELQMFIQNTSSKIIEAEQNGIRIGFHRGHQSAKNEVIGGKPDRNFDKEAYRNYNIEKAIKNWPDLY